MNWQAGDPAVLDLAPALRAIITGLRDGQPRWSVAARWHKTVSHGTVNICNALRARSTELNIVGLTGGVFQNVVLTKLLVAELEQAGFRVLTHHLVPCNDGGLALGQVLVARTMLGS